MRVTITLEAETRDMKDIVKSVVGCFVYELGHGLTLLDGDDFQISDGAHDGRVEVTD